MIFYPETHSPTLFKICQFFCSHLRPAEFLILSPFGEYILGGACFTGFSFRQCSNHTWTCRKLHPEEQYGNWSRVWPCNGLLHAKTSSIVMQDSLMTLLASHVLYHLHSSVGDTPCIWNASNVTWHGTFSQWDLSIRQVWHTCLAYATFTKTVILYEWVFPRR